MLNLSDNLDPVPIWEISLTKTKQMLYYVEGLQALSICAFLLFSVKVQVLNHPCQSTSTRKSGGAFGNDRATCIVAIVVMILFNIALKADNHNMNDWRCSKVEVDRQIEQ